MQNTTFLALLRPIFALKTIIASPPPLAWRWELVNDLMCIRPEKLAFSLTWRPSFFFFFPIWRSSKVGQKNRLNLSEELFFLSSPKCGQKNQLNLSEDRSKFGSRSFEVVSSLQNSPPLLIRGYAPETTPSIFQHKYNLFMPRKAMRNLINCAIQKYVCFQLHSINCGIGINRM